LNGLSARAIGVTEDGDTRAHRIAVRVEHLSGNDRIGDQPKDQVLDFLARVGPYDRSPRVSCPAIEVLKGEAGPLTAKPVRTRCDIGKTERAIVGGLGGDGTASLIGFDRGARRVK